MLREYIIVFILASAILLTGCSESNEVASLPGTPTLLRWEAPFANNEGAPIVMSEIGGYKIYVGKNQSTQYLYTEVDGANTLQYTINNLPAGIYYIAVSAYNTDDLEGPISEVIEKTIDPAAG